MGAQGVPKKIHVNPGEFQHISRKPMELSRVIPGVHQKYSLVRTKKTTEETSGVPRETMCIPKEIYETLGNLEKNLEY